MSGTLDFLRENQYVSSEGFLQTAQYVKDNWGWLKYSYVIAIKVRRRMSELGITQKQLAEKLDCSQQHISTLLSGKVNMTLETIAKLESALGMEIMSPSLNVFQDIDLEPAYLNSPASGEKLPDIKTSTLVGGYKPRKKKGPKAKGE